MKMEMEMKMSYADHMRQLAAQNRIDVHEDETMKPEDAVAFAELRMVKTYPVVDETTYAVALHEMGHCATEDGSGNIDEGMKPIEIIQALMKQEDAAWSWAMANAIEWTPAMEGVHTWARETYRQRAVKTAKATYIKKVHKPLSQVFGKK